jgi:hypothetical protein
MHMPGPDTLAIFIPIVALMIPIVAILTKHQRAMAEMIYSKSLQPQFNPEVQALRQEVQDLKQLVHQQAIALDDVSSRLASGSRPDSVRDRLQVSQS